MVILKWLRILSCKLKIEIKNSLSYGSSQGEEYKKNNIISNKVTTYQ